MDEVRNFFPCRFVGVCRFGGHGVDAAFYRAVVLAVKIVHCIDDLFRLLRSCGAVEIGERLCVLIVQGEDGELLADFIYVVIHGLEDRKNVVKFPCHKVS